MNVANFRIKTIALAVALTAPVLFSTTANALTLHEATQLAIKNSPQIMTEGINVKLKGADKDIAYKFFEPKLDASYTYNDLRGFHYPPEIANVSLSSLAPGGIPNPAFLPDNVRTEDLAVSLKKIFENGIYTELGLSLTKRDSEKDRLSASAAIDNFNKVPGQNLSLDDYFPLTYGVVKFVTRLPLWGRGDLAEAIGDFESKQFKLQAAVANMNHAISSILASAVYAYWDNRAAVVKYQVRQESLARTERWVTKIQEIIGSSPKPEEARAKFAAELNRIDGYVKERRNNLNAAKSELEQSRATLANALGIPLKKAMEMGDAIDVMPEAGVDRDLVDVAKWNEQALAHRLDIQAIKLEGRAADELLKWMKDYADPELNVILAAHQQMVGFGKKESDDIGTSGFLNALQNPSGRTGFTAGVQFSMKFDHVAAKGRVTQATLNKMKTGIDLNAKIQKTGVDLKGLADRVNTSVASTASAAETAKAYRASVEAATADKSQSMATAYRQFEAERDWINAEVDRVNTLATLAKVVVEVRHQTATLVKYTTDSGQVELRDIVTLPKLPIAGNS
ncbi:MAG TPA: TolC family protein [Rhodocyclaceae bacterium]|nr:TolC family protein [Rhodocyclaceae bacterium]